MQLIFNLISLERIFALPVYFYAPALLLIGLFLIRFIRSVLTLHLVTAFTSLVYAFVIAFILSNAGAAIVRLLGIEQTPPAQVLNLEIDNSLRNPFA